MERCQRPGTVEGSLQITTQWRVVNIDKSKVFRNSSVTFVNDETGERRVAHLYDYVKFDLDVEIS